MFRKTLEHFILKYLAVPLTPKIEKGKKLIACVGDSITFGAGVNGRRKETWEYSLQESLGGSWQVINYGISGRTLQDEGDYPYKADKFYPISKAVKAEIYLIMLGTNDAKPYNWNGDRYRRELKAFLEEYMNLENHPRVIVMIPPHCFEDPKIGAVAFDIDGNNIDGPIPRIIRETAQELGIETIDLHSFSAGHGEWFDDGVHPNRNGNTAIAGFIAGELNRIITVR
ncbi:MAG: hypothetical protein K6D03_11600 [Solobacterium sp.]|nr:hypothetical protein [Solobacterium sp.]